MIPLRSFTLKFPYSLTVYVWYFLGAEHSPLRLQCLHLSISSHFKPSLKSLARYGAQDSSVMLCLAIQSRTVVWDPPLQPLLASKLGLLQQFSRICVEIEISGKAPFLRMLILSEIAEVALWAQHEQQ